MSYQKLPCNSSPRSSAEADEELLFPQPPTCKRRDESCQAPATGRWGKYGHLFSHVACAFFFALLGFVLAQLSHPRTTVSPADADLEFSPARDAIAYKHETMDVRFRTPSMKYIGTPSEEMDEAWNGLMQYMNLRVQAAHLARINRTSVPLLDARSGFLATLEVHHQIHCLNLLRKLVYSDAYYPPAAAAAAADEEEDRSARATRLSHADHCIETLRLSLMCHGDAGLVAYQWLADQPRPALVPVVDRQCRDWNALTAWGADNSVPVEDLREPLLRHPGFRGAAPSAP